MPSSVACCASCALITKQLLPTQPQLVCMGVCSGNGMNCRNVEALPLEPVQQHLTASTNDYNALPCNLRFQSTAAQHTHKELESYAG